MLTRATEDWALSVIAREEHTIPVPESFGKVLVTGSAGSLGALVTEYIVSRATGVLTMDIVPGSRGDVTNRDSTAEIVEEFQPDLIFHFAGYKHAPAGEEDPYGAMVVNTEGTRNVIDAADYVGARVVVASTCKACDPETSYGASKLLAERIALNAGQRVVRFYNVVETSGNVFATWASMPEDEPLPVTTCARRFLTAQEALGLSLWASEQESGRYVVTGTRLRSMLDAARSLYPERQMQLVRSRRGDRMIEPEISYCERFVYLEGHVARVESPHDPPRREP